MNESTSNNAESSSGVRELRRRVVQYRNLSAVVDDAEFLASHPHTTIGRWKFGKLLQHLADSVNKSFDGFGYRSNPVVRLVCKLMKKKFLTQPMSPGYKMPKDQEALLPDNSISVQVALANLKSAIARFEKEEPQAPHPAFGALTPEEWLQLHLRHCELHMSFVLPN